MAVSYWFVVDKGFPKAPPCNGKVIKAYSEYDYLVKDLAILAYVMFKVSSGTERQVAEKLIEFEEVQQADVIFGEYDVVAKLMTKDLDKLEDFVSDHVRNVPNVLVTSTMIISREYKSKSQRPKTK